MSEKRVSIYSYLVTVMSSFKNGTASILLRSDTKNTQDSISEMKQDIDEANTNFTESHKYARPTLMTGWDEAEVTLFWS